MNRKTDTHSPQSSSGFASLDAKLLAYCAMAGGALLAAQPAEAAVVYSGVKNLELSDNNSEVLVDLDGGGIVDFAFANWQSAWYSYNYSSNYVALDRYPKNAIGAEGLFVPLGANDANRIAPFNIALSPGTPIPNNNNLLWYWLDAQNARGYLPLSYARFYGGYTLPTAAKKPDLAMPSYGSPVYGSFANREAYLGLRFDMSGNTHYGWIRYKGTDLGEDMLKLPQDNGGAVAALNGTIIDWAYETEPNMPIFAGDRGACIDADGDGYGQFCSKGPDCDDTNARAWDNCTCIDADGDGYGEGPGCKAADCDDTDPAIYEDCPTCTVKFLPGKISKIMSGLSPLSTIVIQGDEDAVFTRDTAIDWGTYNIETMIKLKVTRRLMLALVLVNGKAMNAGDTYNVRVGSCAGDLEVKPL